MRYIIKSGVEEIPHASVIKMHIFRALEGHDISNEFWQLFFMNAKDGFLHWGPNPIET